MKQRYIYIYKIIDASLIKYTGQSREAFVSDTFFDGQVMSSTGKVYFKGSMFIYLWAEPRGCGWLVGKLML